MSVETSSLFVRAPLGNIGSKTIAEAFKIIQKQTQTIAQQFARPQAVPQSGLISSITNFFGRTGQAGARTQRARIGRTPLQQIPLQPAKTTVGISGKTLAGVGVASTAAIGSVGILSFTEGGQELTKSVEKISEDIGKAGENITQFLTDNPIILPLALGIGLIVVLKS